LGGSWGQRQRRRSATWLLVAFVAIAAGAVLGTSTAAARPAAEPVVHLYDVRVVGTISEATARIAFVRRAS
jgi:hypothetical protein